MTQVYTIKETCAILKISHDTLLKIVKRGEIDSTIVGQFRRFTEKHIEKYLKQRSLTHWK